MLKTYPVIGPTFGIHTLQSLQLHFSPFQHLICFSKIGSTEVETKNLEDKINEETLKIGSSRVETSTC